MAGRRRGMVPQNNQGAKRRRDEEIDEDVADEVVALDDGEAPPRAPGPEDEISIKILTEYAEKQKKYIEECKNALKVFEERETRLKRYGHYLETEDERDRYVNALLKLVDKAEDEFEGLEKREEQLLDSINGMMEQDKRLKEVFEETCHYQGCRVPRVEKEWRVEVEIPNQEDFRSEINSFMSLDQLLKPIDLSPVVPLLPNDLDEISWPKYEREKDIYEHMERPLGLAKECAKLHYESVKLEFVIKRDTRDRFYQDNKDSIKIMDPVEMMRKMRDQHLSINRQYPRWTKLVKQLHLKRASVKSFEKEENRLVSHQKYRDKHLKKLRENVIEEMYKCESCHQLMTNGDCSEKCPKVFGNCGHTVCAQCVPKFKDPEDSQKWICPECETPSTKMFTNWSLMRQINPNWEKRNEGPIVVI
ncbi:unnamed protein product [Caenorhabditis brenneri]